MRTRYEGVVATLRALPPLTSATAAMYGCGSVLLVVGAITWEPGKNPRWVISSLAVLAVVFFTWVMLRGRRFTQSEALTMTSAQLFTVGCLTWTTQLSIGAFANGTVLPIVGVYTVWFLHPVAGRVALYLGAAWWFAAIVQQESQLLVPFALSLLAQTIIAAEVFARIKGRMDRLARTDPLTGTLNRRGVTEVLEREMARASRRDEFLSVVAVDLDGLREVNNEYGHKAGDRLLERASRHWTTSLRGRDTIGRTGGDEFVFVLPGTTMEQAGQIVERLSEASTVRWSAGIAMAKPGDTAESVLERADRRMYVAKAARQTA